jgi:hypothetical protein
MSTRRYKDYRKQKKTMKKNKQSRKSHSLKRKSHSQSRKRKQSGGGEIMAPVNLYNTYGKKVNEVAISTQMIGPDHPDF